MIAEPGRGSTARPAAGQLRPVRGDQQIVITSFVREFRGADALIECTMVDAAGKNASRCIMTVAHVDKETNRATDWPPDLMALFFGPGAEPGRFIP
jgi:acyl-CoA thioester hydrolase